MFYNMCAIEWFNSHEGLRDCMPFALISPELSTQYIKGV
jgi:hypothetical protein